MVSVQNGFPVGWFNSFGHVSGVSTDYGIRIVRRSTDPGAGSCVVVEKRAAVEGEFGSLMQRCPGRLLAGRTIRIEGELRTESVSGWAGLWLRADAEEEPNAARDAVLALSPRCTHPGCRVRAGRCQIDHLTEWHQGGETCPDNGGVGCGRHNRMKHRRGYTVTRDRLGMWHTLRPDGTEIG